MCSREGHAVVEAQREGDLSRFVLARGQNGEQDPNSEKP
jgi:hypothetical protein